MSKQSTNVLVAGYQSVEAANADFDSLIGKVKAKQVRVEAVILVAHDADGKVTVQKTGDSVGRTGAKWGGAVGFLVGLAAPPLLAATVVGAAGGADPRQVRRPQGGAGPPRQARRGDEARHRGHHRHVRHRPASGRGAGPARVARQVGRGDRQEGHRGPQGLARGGDGQVRPGPDRAAHPRPHVRRRGRSDAQGLRPRLAHDPRGQGARGRPQRPPGHHRRRRLRRPRHLRRPGPDADLHARPADGPDLQPLPRHRRLLADARRPAHRPQPAPRRLRLHRGVPGPVPRLHREQAQELRRAAAHPQGERLRHGRLRQVAPDAEQRPGRGRVPSTTGPSPGASTTGGASCPARPASTTRSSPRTTGCSACRRARTASPYYFPDDITDKSIEWLHAVRAQDATKPWFMFYSTGCAHAPHHVATGVGGPLQGHLRRRLGHSCASAPSSARRSWASSRRTPSSPSGRRVFPAWDSLDEAPSACTPGRRRSTPATRRTPTGTSAGSSTRSTSWATWTTRWSSTSGATTAPASRARSPARSTS